MVTILDPWVMTLQPSPKDCHHHPRISSSYPLMGPPCSCGWVEPSDKWRMVTILTVIHLSTFSRAWYIITEQSSSILEWWDCCTNLNLCFLYYNAGVYILPLILISFLVNFEVKLWVFHIILEGVNNYGTFLLQIWYIIFRQSSKYSKKFTMLFQICQCFPISFPV